MRGLNLNANEDAVKTSRFSTRWFGTKPTEITVDNYYKQSFDILRDGQYYCHVNYGDLCLDAVKAFHQDNFKEGFEILMNNMVQKGLLMLQDTLDEGVEVWFGTKHLIHTLSELV